MSDLDFVVRKLQAQRRQGASLAKSGNEVQVDHDASTEFLSESEVGIKIISIRRSGGASSSLLPQQLLNDPSDQLGVILFLKVGNRLLADP